jgi:hypothetical protein
LSSSPSRAAWAPTTVWAVSFTVSAVVLAVVVHAGGDVLLRTLLQVLGFVAPILFTVRYIKVVQARGQRAMGHANPGMPAQP